MGSMGSAAPVEYASNSTAVLTPGGSVAMSVRMEARTGPAQGVHTAPRLRPSSSPPQLPADAPTPRLAARLSTPPACWLSHWNGLGHTVSTPNTSSNTAANRRKPSGDKPSTCVKLLNSSATAANDSANPSAMNSGRVRCAGPPATDAPSTTGNMGSTQGAPTVSMPAATASQGEVAAMLIARPHALRPGDATPASCRTAGYRHTRAPAAGRAQRG